MKNDAQFWEAATLIYSRRFWEEMKRKQESLMTTDDKNEGRGELSH